MDSKVFDELVTGMISEYIGNLLYWLRAKLGMFPYKVRVTLFFKNEEWGNHFVEREETIELEYAEESYQEYEKRKTLQEARDILTGKEQA